MQAATLSPGGTWTTPVILAPSTSTVAIGLAADGTGNAVALLTKNVDIGSTITYTLETARHSTGGGWTALASLATGLPSASGKIVATPPGSYVVAYAGNAATSPPGRASAPRSASPPAAAPCNSPPPQATRSPSGP